MQLAILQTYDTSTVHGRGNMIGLSYSMYSVSLPSPEFGNQEELGLTRIQRETRGGDLIVYSDPIWPKTKVFKMQFAGCDVTQRDDFFELVEASLGKVVTFADHEGNSHTGFIKNPQAPATHLFREKGIVLEFEFQRE